MEEFRFTDEKKFCHDMIKLVSRNTSYTLKEIKSSINVGNVRTMVRMHSSPHVDGGFTVSEDDASDICDEIFKLMKWENHKDHVGFDWLKEGIYLDDIAKLQGNCKMSLMDSMEQIGGVI